MDKLKILILLHVLLAVYSLAGIFCKFAGSYDFFSIGFIICYGCVILILGIYALCWQQIIKRLPLTAAFANKAVTVVWGIIWGRVFFDERVTAGRIAGAVVVIAGIILYADAGREKGKGGLRE